MRHRPEQEADLLFYKASRLEDALENVVKAWEALPGDQRYPAWQIQAWLAQYMSPAIDNARAALGRKRRPRGVDTGKRIEV